jgi:hypothetical protein
MQADRSINGAFVGIHGRWAFLRFVTADLVSDGVYELSDIYVMRDTDDSAELMQAGDSFVLASTALRRMTWSTLDLNLERHLKAVTTGRSLSSANDTPFTNTGVGLVPFAPGGVRVTRDGSGTATFNVMRRGRLPVRVGGPGGTYAPLGELDRRSVIEVYADDTYATLVRTLNTASGSDSVAYSAALQTTDGFTPGERLAVRAYHVSSQVGRGHYKQKAAA